jgi:predicted Holliday junction resolvase-like endonuclease
VTYLTTVIFGLIAGAVIVFRLARAVARGRARRRYAEWNESERRTQVKRLVGAQRAGVKHQLGLELTPEGMQLPFEPADVKFLGHPAHFVVFDGKTQVQHRSANEIREVLFVMAPSGGFPVDARLVEECVDAGRVRWLTIRSGQDLRASMESAVGGPS